MSIPTMPSTHTWVQLGPALSRAGRNALFAAADAQVLVWDDDTNEQVTDLLDDQGNPVTSLTAADGWPGYGNPRGIGVPVAVQVVSFSIGQSEQRTATVPVQTLRDAASALVPTDTQVATLLGNPASATRTQGDTVYAPALVGGKAPLRKDVQAVILEEEPGTFPTGSTECAAAVQAALNKAKTLGIPLVAKAGSYLIGSTITISDQHVDLSRVTFGSTVTSGVALDVSGYRKEMKLPRVAASSKTIPGWAQVPGTVGVRLRNVRNCRITLAAAQGWETGLLLWGDGGSGTVYNDITLGELITNKVNIKFDTGTVGSYTNSNLFHGGLCNHDGSEGTNVAGTRHILMTHPASGYVANGNTFIGLTLESPSVVEYQLECHGIENEWIGCRWEDPSNPRVIWGAGARGNQIIGGVDRGLIVETVGVNAGNNVSSFSSKGYARPQSGRYYGPAEHTPNALAQTLNQASAIPFYVQKRMAVDTIACEVTVAAAGATVRMGIYSVGAGDFPQDLVVDAGTVDASTTGVKTAAISVTLDPGLYWLAAVNQGASVTLRTVGTGYLVPVHDGSFQSGTSAKNSCFSSGVSGAFASVWVNTGTATQGTKLMVRAA